MTDPPGFFPAQEHPSHMSTPSPNIGSVFTPLTATLNQQIREGSAPSNVVHLNPMPAIPIVAQLETQASCAGANSNISYPPQEMQSLQNLQAHQATAPMHAQIPLFVPPMQPMPYPQGSPGVQIPAAGAPPIVQSNPAAQIPAAHFIGLPQTHVMSPQLSPPPLWNNYGMYPLARQLTPSAPGYERQGSLSPESDVRALREEVRQLKSKISTLQSGTLQKENEALRQQVTQLTMDNIQLRNMLTYTKNEFERLSLEAQQKKNCSVSPQKTTNKQSFQSLHAHKMQNVSRQSMMDPMQMQHQQSFVSPNGLQQPNNMYVGVTV